MTNFIIYTNIVKSLYLNSMSKNDLVVWYKFRTTTGKIVYLVFHESSNADSFDRMTFAEFRSFVADKKLFEDFHEAYRAVRRLEYEIIPEYKFVQCDSYMNVFSKDEDDNSIPIRNTNFKYEHPTPESLGYFTGHFGGFVGFIGSNVLLDIHTRNTVSFEDRFIAALDRWNTSTLYLESVKKELKESDAKLKASDAKLKAVEAELSAIKIKLGAPLQ